MTGRFSKISAKSASFAVLLLIALAMFGVMASSAPASPGGAFCSNCHAVTGADPQGSLLSNDGTTATYSFTQVYGDWAVFDGTTRLKEGTTGSDTFSGPAGHTFTVFAVDSLATGGATTVVSEGPVTITPTTGTGGSISPSAVQTILKGANVTFTITPNAGFHIADVKVNGTSIGAVATYTFTNVQANATIDATFAADIPFFTIFATAGANGTIAPLDGTTVEPGKGMTFEIKPYVNYTIGSLLIDNDAAQWSQYGRHYYYFFTNVTDDHTIVAKFVRAVTVNVTGLKSGVLRLGKTASAAGTVKPAREGVAKVTIQRKVNGVWKTITTKSATINATSGAYGCTYKPTKKGAFRVQTSTAKTIAYAAAKSLWRTFTVK